MTSIETLLFGQGIRSLKPGFLIYNEVRQHAEYRFTRRALYPPDSNPTQADAPIMRVAGQTPSAITGRFVLELEAKGQEEGEHTFDKGFAVFQQPEVGRIVSKIDGDGAVFSWSSGCVAHVLPPGHRVCAV